MIPLCPIIRRQIIHDLMSGYWGNKKRKFQEIFSVIYARAFELQAYTIYPSGSNSNLLCVYHSLN